MKSFTARLSVFLWVVFSGNASGQITQGSGPVNVCAPSSITYAAPAGASNVVWNFGSFGTSNSASGSFNVLNPANFVAIFNGVVGGNPVTFTVPVTVHAKPVANFQLTQPNNACVVKTVTLTDQSTTSNTIVTRLWTYGDGGSGSAGGTHTYGYTLPGTYSVTLKVTDAYGCDNQISKGTITVNTPPVAVISSSPGSLVSCASSLQASFSASGSSGAGTLSYNWNFGNGQSSQSVNPPAVTFTPQPGSYMVTLTVTSNGCKAVANTFVTVSPPTLSVSVPSSVCVNAAPVVTVQSNQFSTNWNMGNSVTSSIITPASSNPTVAAPAYTSSGIYTITVSAGSGQCTVAPQSFTISVDQVVAGYTSTPPYNSCNAVQTVVFTNQSSGNATQFEWFYLDFQGALVTSTLVSPTFTLSAKSPNPYTYTSTIFNPSISLVATSANGCRDTLSLAQYTLQPPVAWFYKNKREGCQPLSVTFSDSSFAHPAHPITSYTWNNGATTPVTASGTTIPIPKHTFTYTSPGLYRPYLLVETALGCIDTSFIDTVIVETPPSLSFSFSPSTVCPSQPVQIINTSANQSDIQHWHVDSDNGFFSGCVSDPNPSWLFTNVGLHTFTLSGYKNGCKGQAVATQSVLVKGPIGQARFETNCANPRSVNFYTSLQEVQTATINFGDNSSSVLAGNATGLASPVASHTYAAAGDYVVTLTSVNPGTGCAQSVYTMQVQVREVLAVINGPSLLCAGAPAVFGAIQSVGVYTTCGRGYTWYFDSDPPIDQSSPVLLKSFNTPGTHSVTVVVRDINGCQSQTLHTVNISDVSPDFTVSASTICFSDPTLQIVNTTQNTPDTVVNFQWNFGNGTSLTTSLLPVPVQTFTNAFGQPSVYPVVLTATNSKGCIKSFVKTVQVVNPDATFMASSQGMCLPANTPTIITFTAAQAYPSYTFDYGVNATSTAVVNFSVSNYTFMPGSYTVTMRVRDAQGCTNTGSAVITNVQIPVADFIFSSPGSTGGNSICSPAVVSFTNISAPQPLTPSWNMGTGSPVLPLDVVTFPYTASTTSAIAITLSVTTGPPYHCSAAVTRNFTVYVAKAEIVVDRTVVCLGEQVRFSIDSSGGGGVKSWIWDFGDASSSSTVQAASGPPSFTLHSYGNYTATTAGSTSASLIYWSSGDACKYSSQQPIKIINLEGGFLRNKELTATDTIHCLRLADKFSSTAVTNSGTRILYDWTFPDGQKSADSVVTHMFGTPGTKQVTLTVTDDGHDCEATTIKDMTIFPLPSASITAGEHCPERPFTLTVTTTPGVISGTWMPASGMVGSNTFTTGSPLIYSEALASESMTYSLNVTDTNACVSERQTQFIEILQPAPQVFWDTAVVIGQPVFINGDVGNFTYTWTPEITALSCTNCPAPVSTSTNDITYTVVVEDHLKCSQVESTYKIKILPKSSVDVPTAFTPNGDGNNDVIYVDGWGIRKLNYFRIYNRWGQLLFETDNILQGWDGTFGGVPQNTETYIYEVSVQSYISDEPLVKSAYFELLR